MHLYQLYHYGRPCTKYKVQRTRDKGPTKEIRNKMKMAVKDEKSQCIYINYIIMIHDTGKVDLLFYLNENQYTLFY